MLNLKFYIFFGGTEMKKTRRTWRSVISILLLLCMTVAQSGLLTFTVSAEKIYSRVQPLGAGTAANPYRIVTVQNLYWFADEVNLNGKVNISAILMNDIDINPGAEMEPRVYSGTSDNNDCTRWIPIGKDGAVYTGTFNGNGHTVSGVYIYKYVSANCQDIGFFGRVGNGCAIRSLNVSGLIELQNVSGSSPTIQYVGGIAGTSIAENKSVSIYNCTNNIMISTIGSAAIKYGAGIVGWSTGSSQTYIENCSNYGEIYISGKYDCVAGITAYTNGTLYIEN